MRSDWSARCARSWRLDVAATKSLDDLLNFRRPPKWESDYAVLRRMDRLARLREG
jgi:hypothetical protein